MWDEINSEVIKNWFNRAYFGNVLHVSNLDELRKFEEAYSGYTSIDEQFITSETLDLEKMINLATVNDVPNGPK